MLQEKKGKKGVVCMQKEKRKKIVSFILWILFLASFVPYLIMVKAAIFGSDVGLFYPRMAYGFEAIQFYLYVFCIVPIYPACLLLQIIYFVVALRKDKGIKKKIGIFLPIAIIVLIIVPSTIRLLIDKNNDKKFFAKNEDKVWEYLHEHYSDAFLTDCELTLFHRETKTFWLRTPEPFLGDNHYLLIQILDDGTIIDDANEKISEVNTPAFIEAFEEYVDGMYGVDSDIDIETRINAIDMREYNYGDADETLFSKCEYDVTAIYFVETHYDQEEIIKKIEGLYKEILPNLPIIDRSSLNFYVQIGDRYHASIYMTDKDATDNEITLFFSGYTYKGDSEPSIPHETVDVILE